MGKNSRRLISGLLLGVWLCLAALPGKAPGRALAENGRPGYLILCADELRSGLSGLIALKESQGYRVTVRTPSQTGATPAELKAAITAAAEAGGLQAVLLVGDAAHIPPWPNQDGTFSTDLYYATLDGDADYLPDVLLGRLPARSLADLAAYTAKLSAYAADPSASFPLDRASLIAGADALLSADWEAALNAAITAYTQPAKYTGSFPQAPQAGGDRLYAAANAAQGADVLAALQGGRAWMIYAGNASVNGWSAPQVTTAQIAALESGLAGVVASFAGYTASFGVDESFAARWVLQPQAGALVFIGAAESTLAWEDNARLLGTFFDAFFEPSSETIGAVWQQALTSFDRLYFGFDLRIPRLYAELYQIWGDPTLPTPLSVWKSEFSLHLAAAEAALCAPGSAVLELALETNSGSRAPAVFSIRGLPGGVQAQFTPSGLSPPGAAQLTLTAASGTAAGETDLWVQAANPVSGFTRQVPLKLRVDTALPASPWPLEPQSGTRGSSFTPTLVWSAAAGAVTYTLELADNPQFEPRLAQVTGLSATTYTLAAPLPAGERIYWRVQAVNACGAGAVSAAAVFYTRPAAGACTRGDTSEALYASQDSGLSGWEPASGSTWTPATEAWDGQSLSLYTASAQAAASQDLVSAPIAIPAALRDVTLTLLTRFDFGPAEASLHGGLVELSRDGGATWSAVPADAQRLLPYTTTLTSLYGNPLGGQAAWGGSSGGWQTAALDVRAYSGETLRLRFRLGASSPAPTGSAHWAIARVALTGCSGPADQSVRLTLAEDSVVLPADQDYAVDFELANLAQPGYYDLSVEPQEWQAALAPASLYLPLDGALTGQVTLRAPADSPPGVQKTFIVRAVSQTDAQAWSAASLTAELRRVQFTLAAPAADLTGQPAQWLRFGLWVENQGNAADEFTLSAASARGWRLRTAGPTLALAAGERGAAWVEVQLPAGAFPAHSDLIQVELRSAADPSETRSLTLSARTAGRAVYLPCVVQGGR